MDSSLQHSFINPTTCFTVACVAFSAVSLLTLWRNQQPAEPHKARDESTERSSRTRQKGIRRRRAVDSIYVAPEDQDRLIHFEDAPEQKTINPIEILSELVTLGASLAQQIRANVESTTSAASLIGELSSLTTSLCRVQHSFLTNPPLAEDGNPIFACFNATTSSLHATFRLLQANISSDGGDEVLHIALEQLRDQRPAVDFLLETSSTRCLPPTPPSETEMNSSRFLNPSFAAASNWVHQPPPTGLTPSVDSKAWLGPPPEYTPPDPASSSALVLEKTDSKSSNPTPPESEDRVEETAVSDEWLYNAVTENDSELLADLLSRGGDANEVFGDLQRTALHQAAHLNHCACLSVLLNHGTAILSTEDAKGDTALHHAAWAGHVEALSMLLAHGADVDWVSGRDGYSPLWCAISAYHIDAARLLLKHGARVSLRSASGGLSPLHQAAVTGQSAMCELLLERGAQVDAIDDDQNTALHYAAACGSLASVKVLLRNGAQVGMSQAQGLTPAHWAAHKGHTDVLALLLNYRAPVNAKAEHDATPLHLAANRGHLPAARLLLEKGAKRKTEASWDGVEGTPTSMATSKGHNRLAKVIESWGRT